MEPIKHRITHYWSHRAEAFQTQRIREFEDEKHARWLEEFNRYIPHDRPLRVLDLGTGTGFFAFVFAAEGHEVPWSADASLLTDETEKELIKQLAALPDEIRLAARDYDPSRVNKYVSELAGRFHRFYTVCRIKDAEPGLLEARLKLCDCTRRVIAIALGIIGVSAPEKM